MVSSPKKEVIDNWFSAQNRHIFIESNFQRYSQKAADLVASSLQKILQQKQHAVFVPSSGKSPMKMFEILRQMYKDKIDWTRIIVVQMDEYWKMSCDNNKSMSLSIEQNLIAPLGIKKYIHYFDAHGKLIHTLGAYENIIEELGGIDLVVHGIGRNGHIGFNEPGSPLDSLTRKVTLADSTLEANFTHDKNSYRNYRKGVTIGLSVLTRAQHAILLLSGKSKDAIVKKLFSEKPSQNLPASSLFLNPLVDCVLDHESFPFF